MEKTLVNTTLTRLLALSAPLALLVACASEPAATSAPESTPAPVAAQEPVTAPADSAPVHLTVREAQELLLEKGYNPGVVDGISGPRTANALRQFQRDEGLVGTGRLDQETMNALAR